MTKLSSVSSASEKDGRSHVGQMLHTPLIDSIIALPSCSESVRVMQDSTTREVLVGDGHPYPHDTI